MGTRRSTGTDLTAQYWDATAARRVLREWEGSGLSMAVFARERGIKWQRLSRWRRRLEATAGRRARPRVEFVPAVMTTPATLVRVRLGAGIEIEAVDVAELPAAWLAAIARELARP